MAFPTVVSKPPEGNSHCCVCSLRKPTKWLWFPCWFPFHNIPKESPQKTTGLPATSRDLLRVTPSERKLLRQGCATAKPDEHGRLRHEQNPAENSCSQNRKRNYLQGRQLLFMVECPLNSDHQKADSEFGLLAISLKTSMRKTVQTFWPSRQLLLLLSFARGTFCCHTHQNIWASDCPGSRKTCWNLRFQLKRGPSD